VKDSAIIIAQGIFITQHHDIALELHTLLLLRLQVP
jgi:hypothetical protein